MISLEQRTVKNWGILIQSLLFSLATIFTTDPAPGRCGCGFAVNRAVQAGYRLKKRADQHHHFSIITKLCWRRLKNKPAGSGGKLQLKEQYFDQDGIHLIWGR